MKKSIRALGVDDSVFVPHTRGMVKIVGTVVRAPAYLEGVILKDIEIDGADATDKIISMFSTRFGKQIRLVFTQGLTFGGFNVVNIKKIHEKTGVPVIAVVRKKPDMEKIENALKKHFDDWEKRFEILKEVPLNEVYVNGHKIYAHIVGMEIKDATSVINNFTLRGAMPEPLRYAHIIASALHFGVSKGKP